MAKKSDKPKLSARFYVYALIDPRDNEIFYVGKGQAERLKSHVKNVISGIEPNILKEERIRKIINSGRCVVEKILIEGISEDSALRLERQLIDDIGLENLTNISPGRLSGIERAEALARKGLAIAEMGANLSAEAPNIKRDFWIGIIQWSVSDWKDYVRSFSTRLSFDDNGKPVFEF